MGMPADGMRTRWAAIGAAIAVTLGAGGLGVARAMTVVGEPSSFVSITPCRLADTRPGADHVGEVPAEPIGPDTSITIEAHGAHGNCEFPSDATTLSLNVTAVGPTAPTFLTLWPTATGRPKASHLNPTPGEPPTPNAVTVGLDGDGRFSIYNRFGTVDVVVDVVGFYVGPGIDDSYTKSEVDALVADAVADAVAAIPTPIVVDRTIASDTTDAMLAEWPGLRLEGTCNSTVVGFRFQPESGVSMWFYGTKATDGTDNLSVKFADVASYGELADSYMHVDGLLFVAGSATAGTETRYFQINVQAHRRPGGSCLIWAQLSPGTLAPTP